MSEANEPTRARGRFRFSRRMRLKTRRQFEAVYAERVGRNVGPLAVYTRPNGLGHCRLGLSVPRRVGSAVRRNRIKRLLREAFRTVQHELPPSYDVVLNVRAHHPLQAADYGQMLVEACRALDRIWNKRQSTSEPPRDTPPSAP